MYTVYLAKNYNLVEMNEYFQNSLVMPVANFFGNIYLHNMHFYYLVFFYRMEMMQLLLNATITSSFRI